MFNTSDGYSLADIAAATGGNRNNGFGDGAAWIWPLAILFLFGAWGGDGGGLFGGWGGRGGAASGALTRGELCQDMNFADLQSGIRDIQSMATTNNVGVLNGVSQLASAIAGAQAATQVAFDNTNLAMVQGQNALQTQISGYSCDTRQQIADLGYTTLQGQNALATQLSAQAAAHDRAIADVRYDMAAQVNGLQTSLATATRDIIDNQNEGTRAILKQMCDDKIAALQSENQALKFAASQAAQNNYLVDQLAPKLPVASYTVPNPFTGTYGAPGGCGCMG